MLIYCGNTPIIIPGCPTPNNGNNDNGDITWKGIIISLIILGIVCFIIYKLLEYLHKKISYEDLEKITHRNALRVFEKR